MKKSGRGMYGCRRGAGRMYGCMRGGGVLGMPIEERSGIHVLGCTGVSNFELLGIHDLGCTGVLTRSRLECPGTQ